MINLQHRNILHSIMDQCIDITNETDYNASFDYSAHIESFVVSIYRKGEHKSIYHEYVHPDNRYSNVEKKHERVTVELALFLLEHSEYQQEIQAQEEVEVQV